MHAQNYFKLYCSLSVLNAYDVDWFRGNIENFDSQICSQKMINKKPMQVASVQNTTIAVF